MSQEPNMTDSTRELDTSTVDTRAMDTNAVQGDAAQPGFGPSVPTVLWGLILALVAGFAIVHQVTDVDLNLAVGVPVVLLATGAALVAWGVAGLFRRRAS
jgi:hypothetical protein